MTALALSGLAVRQRALYPGAMKVWMALLFVAACSGSDASSGGPGPAPGPGGAYDTFERCATWSGGDSWCPTAPHTEMFVCDGQPGGDCVQSSKGTPSQGQQVFCCSFPCVRGAPSSDQWCTGAKKESYISYGKISDVAKQLGCDESSQSNLICC